MYWIEAEKNSYEDNEDEAFKHYEKAFEEAKYTEGNKQNKLVNKYISLCAKLGKFKEFKKAMAWAYFIGLDIRLLRGNEDFNYQDPKHLKMAFEIFKKVSFVN